MAKGTDAFERKIKNELDIRAFKNPLFEAKYQNPDKNINDCCTYILNTVKKSGANGFENNEIYSMAIHYYSEETIDLGGAKPNATVIINESVKLTQKEIDEAKAEAKERLIKKQMNKITGKDKKVVKKSNDSDVQTLF